MRKSSFLIITVMVMFSLFVAACGGGAAEPAAPEQPAAQEEAAAEEVAPAEEAAPAEEEAPAEEAMGPVEIRWFVGLGTGHNPEQVAAQEAVVEGFNAAHDDIELVLAIVQNDVAYDQLRTEIASGNAPDIVGPVGIRGANEFLGLWLDLQPLVDATGYDLTQYDEATVAFYREDGALTGIPFAVFPSIIYFNRDLFDEAGLDYPPQAFDQPYADGDPWDWNKVEELGLLLTVDGNGNDATSPDFDPENIVQFGFAPQWSAAARIGSAFGAGSLVDDQGNAQVPDSWRAAWNWYYDGMWSKHFSPNQAWVDSDLLAAGNPFSSGNVAMAHSQLWYTCCIDAATVPNWDVAVAPSFEGSTTSPLHADTFRIMGSTEHPEEAFTVLSYLLNEAAPDLQLAYGAMPAATSAQSGFFAGLDEKYPQDESINWDVVAASLAYPDIPSHEAWMPNFGRSDDRVTAFWSEVNTTPDLDVDAAIDTLISDLQALYDQAE